MAIYHLSARVVSRGTGQSAVEKAAYNARTQLHDDRLGRMTRDYALESPVVFSGIFAPPGSPAWVYDRAQLWNRVEAAEKRSDAQLAREIELALPYELTHEQREWLVKDFVREQFVRRGMIADVNIHLPDKGGDPRNIHAHVLLAMRALDGEEGFAAKKNREWNGRPLLQEWRAAWDRTSNRYLERFGHAARIDHRSNQARGIAQEPGIHLGVASSALERQGVRTQRGDIQRALQARNRTRVRQVKSYRDAQKLLITHSRARELPLAPPLSKQSAVALPEHMQRAVRLVSYAAHLPVPTGGTRHERLIDEMFDLSGRKEAWLRHEFYQQPGHIVEPESSAPLLPRDPDKDRER